MAPFKESGRVILICSGKRNQEPGRDRTGGFPTRRAVFSPEGKTPPQSPKTPKAFWELFAEGGGARETSGTIPVGSKPSKKAARHF